MASAEITSLLAAAADATAVDATAAEIMVSAKTQLETSSARRAWTGRQGQLTRRVVRFREV